MLNWNEVMLFAFRPNFWGAGSPRGVLAKMPSCGIVVSEFELQSCCSVHFRINTLGKGMNALISPAMGLTLLSLVYRLSSMCICVDTWVGVNTCMCVYMYVRVYTCVWL